MKILTVFVLASLALPAFAANKTCRLSAATQKKHAAFLDDESSYRGLEGRMAELMMPTAYNPRSNTLELGYMQSSCDGGALECKSNERVTSLEDSDIYQVLGTDDCSTKFVELSSVEDRGADGETGDSDLEIQTALNTFLTKSQDICDALNVSNRGQSVIEVKNSSTTSGFFFGTGERVHLEFNARCIIQD